MESEGRQKCNFDGGFDKLVGQEDFQDERPADQQSNLSWQQLKVSIFNMSSERRPRLAALALALLAALLLIVDISLGAHYNNLKDTHLTLDDVELIREDLAKLKEDYKTAVGVMKDAQKQTDNELNQQAETNWEFEHQTKRTKDYEAEIEKTTQDIGKLRLRLPLISDGCKHCPEGWILMNFMCYYFSFVGKKEKRTWEKARVFCQTYGGDLLIIDSKDTEKSTIDYLMDHQEPSQYNEEFWIGLRDYEEEGTWKWVNGTHLVEGYWKDGEPNDTHNNEDCATVSPKRNFFKAWNDANCKSTQKWICGKAPTS
ncbi:CD209 antigen-like protein E [Melanotaenia boesemani]|uniref:CD209 antigen-like protein E n=1 Tax=Melanotaenia boesemani TaxID=1250792 RepID=UPI001C042D13|nr:CD209 antigen-like protein E [Melanotaenia boesemani]